MSSRILFVAAVLGFLGTWPAAAQQPTRKPPTSRPAAATVRYQLADTWSEIMVELAELEASGAGRLRRREEDLSPRGLQPAESLVPLVEGYYLAIAFPPDAGPRETSHLIRLQVTEVLPQGAANVRIAPQAVGKVAQGMKMVVFRPLGSTTRDMQAAPDHAPLDYSTGEAFQLLQSVNNLRQIVVALHSFHDVHGFFPPAVVLGPDGKPWHSWRVLVLPYLEMNHVYEQYRFDEPWDGPHNKQLLAEAPPVYWDPIHGESNDGLTHYALATGDGTAFPLPAGRWDLSIRSRRLAMSAPPPPEMRSQHRRTHWPLILGTLEKVTPPPPPKPSSQPR